MIPDGWKLVPIDATDEMLEAALSAGGQRCYPHEAETENGIPIESGISEVDARDINDLAKQAIAVEYRAAIAAAPKPPK